MSKKGVSILIGWVLLIGLTVMLAMMVSTWMKQQAEDTTEAIIKDAESDVRCSEVSLKAYVVDELNCKDINISNSGYHTIVKVSLRSKFGSQEFDVNLIPQKDSKVLNIPINEELDIIPVIQSNNELIGCSERKFVVTC